jgi:hypothetical protein
MVSCPPTQTPAATLHFFFGDLQPNCTKNNEVAKRTKPPKIWMKMPNQHQNSPQMDESIKFG